MRTRTVILILLALAGCTTTGPVIEKAKMSEGYYMKGLSYLQERNFELALVEFERSIQTDRKNKMSYYAVGIVNDMQGKPAEAEKYYKETIDIDSDFSEAHNALGVVYSKQQKWKEALKSFKKALENKLYATPHIPHLNMGDVYMAQHDYAKAIEAYRESKRYVNQDFTILKLGTALLEAGKIKEAIEELQEGEALSFKNVNIRYTLALAHLKDGNKKSALAEFKKIIELAPESDVALKARDYQKTIKP